MLPEGGECAFKEGHYAYFLPSIDESEPLVPFFRNIDHARAHHEVLERSRAADLGAASAPPGDGVHGLLAEREDSGP